MMRARRCLSALVVLALAAGCGAPPKEIDPADVERAQAALKPFKGQLMGALVKGLEEGPESAIQVCSEKAPGIAASLEQGGVEMGRTSHRLRNPANAPAPWMEPALKAYAAGTETRPWVAVSLEGDRIGYLEPIRVKPLCLQCHGGEIDRAVADRIAALYPEDRATGFESGDFRGLFWVTLPAGD